jgi:hypothetical protein
MEIHDRTRKKLSGTNGEFWGTCYWVSLSNLCKYLMMNHLEAMGVEPLFPACYVQHPSTDALPEPFQR